jgi:hypothetical protein
MLATEEQLNRRGGYPYLIFGVELPNTLRKDNGFRDGQVDEALGARRLMKEFRKSYKPL